MKIPEGYKAITVCAKKDLYERYKKIVGKKSKITILIREELEKYMEKTIDSLNKKK